MGDGKSVFGLERGLHETARLWSRLMLKEQLFMAGFMLEVLRRHCEDEGYDEESYEAYIDEGRSVAADAETKVSDFN